MNQNQYLQIHQRGGPEPRFPVSATLLIPGAAPGFDVLADSTGDKLLADAKTPLPRSIRGRLAASGAKTVFVAESQRPEYDLYIRERLSGLLGDESVSVSERVRAWHDASLTLVRELFESDLPVEIARTRMARVKTVLLGSMKFFSDPATLRELSRFLDDAYDEYVHGLATMVLTASVLGTYETMDNLLLASCGAGALLHDIGKTRFPAELLAVPPGELSGDQRTTLCSHPAVGVSVCSRLPLLQETLQCILFHHEMEDGSGYPTGARGEDIPFYPKVVAVCNAYENLTRPAHGVSVTSFEAMKIIKGSGPAVNADIFKRLVAVLSKAELV